MVTIGTLSERITLQNETRTPDTAGGASVSWSDIATVFAQVTPLSAGEKWQTGQQLSTRSYRFTIRVRTDVSGAARLVWAGVSYNITAVLLNANPRYTDIIATAGAAV